MIHEVKNRLCIQSFFFFILCLSIIFSDTLVAFQTRDTCNMALESIDRQMVCGNHQIAKRRLVIPESINSIISIGTMANTQHWIDRADLDSSYFNLDNDVFRFFYDFPVTAIKFNNINTAPAKLVMSFHIRRDESEAVHGALYSLPSYDEAVGSVSTADDRETRITFQWLDINNSCYAPSRTCHA